MQELLTVVETPEFLKDLKRSGLSEEDHRALINFLAANPTAGALLSGTGGVRKLRFAAQGRGKSGSHRVVYYYHDRNMPLFALNLFAKNVKADLSDAERNAMKRLVDVLVQSYEE